MPFMLFGPDQQLPQTPPQQRYRRGMAGRQMDKVQRYTQRTPSRGILTSEDNHSSSDEESKESVMVMQDATAMTPSHIRGSDDHSNSHSSSLSQSIRRIFQTGLKKGAQVLVGASEIDMHRFNIDLEPANDSDRMHEGERRDNRHRQPRDEGLSSNAQYVRIRSNFQMDEDDKNRAKTMRPKSKSQTRPQRSQN